MPPVRYFVYVLGTIWIVVALVLFLTGLAFERMGLEVIITVFVVSTIAGVVSVFSQR